MGRVTVTAERVVAAPAEQVYRCFADYRQHHPNFLPPAFSEFQIERGGIGAGTVITFRMTAGGRSRFFRMEVSEPEPGHVLVETDAAAKTVTRFIVRLEGEKTRVLIETAFESATGVAGFFERLFAPRVLSGIYADELTRLERYLATLWKAAE